MTKPGYSNKKKYLNLKLTEILMEVNRNITLATKTIHTKFYFTYFKLE